MPRTQLELPTHTLHVEVDSMGSPVGVPSNFDPDDVIPLDVPDPLVFFLSLALIPAYVDVDLTNLHSFNHGDVGFAQHVPSSDDFNDWEDDMIAQVSKPYALESSDLNFEGEWWVYLHGAYEHHRFGDGDPETDPYVLSAGIAGTAIGLIYMETLRDFVVDETGTVIGNEIYANLIAALQEVVREFGILNAPNCSDNVMCGPYYNEGGQIVFAPPVLKDYQLRTIRFPDGGYPAKAPE